MGLKLNSCNFQFLEEHKFYRIYICKNFFLNILAIKFSSIYIKLQYEKLINSIYLPYNFLNNIKSQKSVIILREKGLARAIIFQKHITTLQGERDISSHLKLSKRRGLKSTPRKSQRFMDAVTVTQVLGTSLWKTDRCLATFFFVSVFSVLR